MTDWYRIDDPEHPPPKDGRWKLFYFPATTTENGRRPGLDEMYQASRHRPSSPRQPTLWAYITPPGDDA